MLVLTKTLAPTVTLAEAETVVAVTLPATLPVCTPTVLPTNAVLLADIATVELPTSRLVLLTIKLLVMLAEAVITVAVTLPTTLPE